MRKAALFFWIALTAAGCASAPGYRAPEVQVPQSFRETRDTVVAIAVAPSDTAVLLRWPELGDTTLTRLIDQLAHSMKVIAEHRLARCHYRFLILG